MQPHSGEAPGCLRNPFAVNDGAGRTLTSLHPAIKESQERELSNNLDRTAAACSTFGLLGGSGAADAMYSSTGRGSRKSREFSAASHASRFSAGTMARLRFSSPGAWKRRISKCSSALMVSIENEFRTSPSAGRHVTHRAATVNRALSWRSIRQRTGLRISRLARSLAAAARRATMTFATKTSAGAVKTVGAAGAQHDP